MVFQSISNDKFADWSTCTAIRMNFRLAAELLKHRFAFAQGERPGSFTPCQVRNRGRAGECGQNGNVV